MLAANSAHASGTNVDAYPEQRLEPPRDERPERAGA